MGLSEEKLVYKALRALWLVTIVVISEILIPFSLILFPLLIINQIVCVLVRFLGPKYGRILQGMSSLAASDELYSKPIYTVLLYYFVDDVVDIKEHRQLFLDKVVQARSEETGKLKYPELQMKIGSLLGYSVWKVDETFNINHHVKLCDKKELHLRPGQKLDEDGLMTAMNDLLIKPFQKERSPWEILVFHGAQSRTCSTSRQSLIVFRYHHALSDGYSITKLMENVTTGNYFHSNLQGFQREVPMWKSLLEILTFPFTGIFVIVVYLGKYVDKNVWSFKVDFGKEKIRDMTYVCSESVPLDKIKNLKNKLGASFNGIVLAAIAGGIRKHFVLKEKAVPPNMHVGLSFPVPGHPSNKLTNHWTAAFIRLPIGVSSSHKRLDEIQQQFKTVETLLVSKMPHVGSKFGGVLFKKAIAYTLKNLLQGSTCSMSIFPGPENLQFLTGEKITSGGFLLGPLSNQGVALTVVSYNGGLRVFFGAEKSILHPEDCKQVVRNIAQEFDHFIWNRA